MASLEEKLAAEDWWQQLHHSMVNAGFKIPDFQLLIDNPQICRSALQAVRSWCAQQVSTRVEQLTYELTSSYGSTRISVKAWDKPEPPTYLKDDEEALRQDGRRRPTRPYRINIDEPSMARPFNNRGLIEITTYDIRNPDRCLYVLAIVRQNRLDGDIHVFNDLLGRFELVGTFSDWSTDQLSGHLHNYFK